MSTWIFLVLLLVIVVFVVIVPLWTRRADRPLGRGIETDDIAERWQEEKDRLVAEQRSLDMALAGGEISTQAHEQDRAILQHEANRALDRLREARGSGKRRPSAARPGIHPINGGVLATAVVLVTCGAAYFLSLQDLRRDVSPHADGRIPMPVATADGKSPTAKSGDGTPDIAAMVAGLEARVKAGGEEATVRDLLMLGRSYRVMARKEHAIKTYRRVLSAEPNNLAATMAIGSILLNSTDKVERAEADQLIDRALAINPDFPDALWLKSLAFVRDHEIEKAKSILNRLSPMVESNPTAKTAIDNLLSRLEQPRSTTPTRAN